MIRKLRHALANRLHDLAAWIEPDVPLVCMMVDGIMTQMPLDKAQALSRQIDAWNEYTSRLPAGPMLMPPPEKKQ